MPGESTIKGLIHLNDQQNSICQCQDCLREFARSDCLRRHKSSGVYKALTTLLEDDSKTAESDMETDEYTHKRKHGQKKSTQTESLG